MTKEQIAKLVKWLGDMPVDVTSSVRLTVKGSEAVDQLELARITTYRNNERTLIWKLYVEPGALGYDDETFDTLDEFCKAGPSIIEEIARLAALDEAAERGEV